MKLFLKQFRRFLFGIENFSKVEVKQLRGIFDEENFNDYYFNISEKFLIISNKKYSFEITEDFYYSVMSTALANVEYKYKLSKRLTFVEFQERILCDMIRIESIFDEFEKSFCGYKIDTR